MLNSSPSGIQLSKTSRWTDGSAMLTLEACIGRTPGSMHVKVIDHVDAGAQRWLAASPLMVAGFGIRNGIAISLGGGKPGFVGVAGTARLRLPAAFLDNPDFASEEIPVDLAPFQARSGRC